MDHAEMTERNGIASKLGQWKHEDGVRSLGLRSGLELAYCVNWT